MIILAFETSCDDTSIAVFNNDKLIYMDTMSQINIHNKTGWVVPEIAAREHANSIFRVLKKVLKNSNLSLYDINYIALTKSPWLIPSLLTGLSVAKSLSRILNIEILYIDHIEAHIFSNYLWRKEEDISYPLVCLTVSWWHNEIYYMENITFKTRLWWTMDDSAWEAFDKVAKMLWLWYPGGPIISKYAKEYEELLDFSKQAKSPLFPRVWLNKDEYDFSFSWLKSAVKREVDKRKKLSKKDIKELSYEFENAIIEVLVYKLINAWKKTWVKTIMLAWWVSANDKLNKSLEYYAKLNNFIFISPIKKIYSMDNAAMVGINAYYKIKNYF